MTTPSDADRQVRERPAPASPARTAVDSAAFLLPYLRPGMSLLDVGCGPGSITAGLAHVVAPGEVTGVDLRMPKQVSGFRFVQADACRLPFPDSGFDAGFDAVFMHGVLQHLPDPLVALREARRVARPGAVIGVRDCDWDGQLIHPTSPMLARSFALLDRMREGTSPRVGKQLRELLTRAGFSPVLATASILDTADDPAATGRFTGRFFTTPAVRESALREGWATERELDQMRDAWLAWGEDPGAYWVRIWCEVVAYAD